MFVDDQMTNTVLKGPFTLEQVAALNAYQTRSGWHPFTCGALDRQDDPHATYQALHGGDWGQLVATEAGWICPACDYKQDWAYRRMIDTGYAILADDERKIRLGCLWIDRYVVDEIFEKAEDQVAALVGLYKLVFPEWDQVESCGWPVCNKATWKAICSRFQAFDERVTNKRVAWDKQVMPGGLWLNNGFSCSDVRAEELKDWEVIPCLVKMKEET